MPSPNDIFTTLYRAYLPEMVEIVIHAYEYYRNLDMPKECVPYKVNRKSQQETTRNYITLRTTQMDQDLSGQMAHQASLIPCKI